MSDFMVGLLAWSISVIICIPIIFYFSKRLPKDLGIKSIKFEVIEGFKDCPHCKELEAENGALKELYDEPCDEHKESRQLYSKRGCFMCFLEDYKEGKVVISIKGGKGDEFS